MPNQVIASPLDLIDTTSGSVATPSAGNTTFFAEGGIAKTKDSSGTVRILGTTTVQGRTSISLTSGNNVLTVASTYYQNITGFSFWPMTLPNVTTLVIGHSFEITNNHSAQCPISSNNGTWIVQVPVGYTYKFVCISTSDNTPAGWLFFHIPSGVNTGNQALTNTSDATSHTITLSSTGGSVQLVEGAGITLTTSGTASDAIVTVSSTGGGGGGGTLAYAPLSSSSAISVGSYYVVDASAGDVILTLSDGTSAGEVLSIKKVDSSGNTVTINNANIDGDTSITITIEDESIDLYWTGSNFLIN